MIRWDRATAEYVIALRRRARWSVSVAAGVPTLAVGTLAGVGPGAWPVIGAAVLVAGGAVFALTTFFSSRSTSGGGT